MREIHHITLTDDICKHCGQPFKFYWYDKKEKNGFSETRWQDAYHKKCLEEITGSKCKTLQEINEERKNQTT